MSVLAAFVVPHPPMIVPAVGRGSEAQIKATGITYDIGFDPGAEIYNLYALPNSGITRNVLIDKSGTVVFLTRLYDEQQFMALKNKIAELLRVH